MTATDARRPSWGGRLLDRVTGRFLGLRSGAGYSVAEGLRVPLRDGVQLAADLYIPARTPHGTVLVRGPYGRGAPGSLLQARIFAARGYQVLMVSSRGTFGSGGVFEPERTEAADGQDVVRWMTTQPWFTGRYATLGTSYLGYTQWALLADPPMQPVAAVIVVGPHDFAAHHWGTGALNLDILAWGDLVAHQEDGGTMRTLRRQAGAARRLAPVQQALPVAEAGERYFAGKAPWYRDWVTRPDLDDPFWAPTRHGAALDSTEVPVLLVGGWQDFFLGQTLEQYARLHARGVDVALTVGPWTHIDVAGRGAGQVARESLAWLEQHLAGAGGGRSHPVRVMVTGTDSWRALPAWPPPTSAQHWYPQLAGGLTAAPAPAGTASAGFRFDPADPTPTVGGPLLGGGGAVDDGALAARPDVLTFTGEPLPAALEVLGGPVLELAHATDRPHADLFVRLSEVDPRGRSRNVTEGYLRLDPDRGPAPVTLPLRHAAHRFAAGSRLRLLVAGGSHPQYARNLGTGENPGTGSAMQAVTHTVDLTGTRLTLPVAPA